MLELEKNDVHNGICLSQGVVDSHIANRLPGEFEKLIRMGVQEDAALEVVDRRWGKVTTLNAAAYKQGQEGRFMSEGEKARLAEDVLERVGMMYGVSDTILRRLELLELERRLDLGDGMFIMLHCDGSSHTEYLFPANQIDTYLRGLDVIKEEGGLLACEEAGDALGYNFIEIKWK